MKKAPYVKIRVITPKGYRRVRPGETILKSDLYPGPGGTWDRSGTWLSVPKGTKGD